jgi:hypothetical protein
MNSITALFHAISQSVITAANPGLWGLVPFGIAFFSAGSRQARAGLLLVLACGVGHSALSHFGWL